MAKVDDFTDEILLQCAYALGKGAQMPIERKALAALGYVVRKGFADALSAATDPTSEVELEKEWKKSSDFILGCCVRIGQVAATNADFAKPAHYAITEADLKSAYKSVRVPFAAGLPGEYCPDW